jgi:hypothetical protein
MGNLVFLRRSDEYRHAAATALRSARATPSGSERNKLRVRARGLMELARSEAWLEGQRRHPRGVSSFIATSSSPMGHDFTFSARAIAPE